MFRQKVPAVTAVGASGATGAAVSAAHDGAAQVLSA
jgi:hypothetical protein